LLTELQLKADLTETQPVSVATLPLPSGAATGTKQDAQTALLTTIDGDTSNLDVALSTRLKAADTLAGVTTVAAVTAITNALPAGNNNIGDVDIASIAAGTNIIGKVGIDQTTPGTTNGVQVNAALPAGTNAIGKLAANSGVDIGDVDITSIVPGTGATNLGKAEDAPHSTGDVGVMALAVRNDAGAALAGNDG
jgi:hypothetical protein